MTLFSACKNEADNSNEPTNQSTDTAKILQQDTIAVSDSISFIIKETANENDSFSDINVRTINTKSEFNNTIEGIGKINKIFSLDIDSNAVKELYILTKPAFSGIYGKLLVYMLDSTNTVKQVLVGEIKSEEKKDVSAMINYDGNDTFFVDTIGLVRKFKIYEPTDTMRKSIGYQNFYYNLNKNSDPWQLELKGNAVTKD